MLYRTREPITRSGPRFGMISVLPLPDRSAKDFPRRSHLSSGFLAE
jgi:hypothetical protein